MVSSKIAAGAVLAATATAVSGKAIRGNSDNWAGGIAIEPGKIVEAGVDIVVPECTLGTPAYDYVPYGVSGWVGIDGNTDCNEVVLQTGFSCGTQRINGTTTATYSAWSEWYPHPQTTYPNFTLQAGDVVSMKVVAHNKTAGTSYLHNRRTGQKVSTSYTSEAQPLCLNDAEWIVESELTFYEHFIAGERTAGYKPFFEFEKAEYKMIDGKVGKVQADGMFNMVQNGTQVAEAVFQEPGKFYVNDTTPADWNPGN